MIADSLRHEILCLPLVVLILELPSPKILSINKCLLNMCFSLGTVPQVLGLHEIQFDSYGLVTVVNVMKCPMVIL